MPRFCGIDVGERLVFPAVLDLSSREVLWPPGKLDPRTVVPWVDARMPEAIAIDASARPSRGLLADPAYRERHGIRLGRSGADRRVCEWRLGIGGCYSTRRSPHACAGWMRTGFDLFAAFEALGRRVDLGLGGDLVEVHPTYGFRSLLGACDEGLRVRCDPERRLAPKSPRGSRGHLQRIALASALLRAWSVDPRPHRPRLAASLDWTDALLAACLAALRSEGRTRLVGDPGGIEGGIVLASEPLRGAARLVG
jgi:hypothetical protein